MPLSNLSAEAEALAGRLPAALPDLDEGIELDVTAVRDAEGETAMGRRTGVDETRREELRVFLTERFAVNLEVGAKIAEGVQHDKDSFLSDPVLEIIQKLYKMDYDLLGEYI